MNLSDELVKDFKEIYKKKYDKELSDEEARDAGYRLAGFFEILMKCAEEDIAKKKRLKKEPDGFPIDGSRSCAVCSTTITPENGWYDKYGQKCLDCRRAMKNGVIPTYVSQNRDSYFLPWYLQSHFEIKHQTMRKLIRQEKLFPRIVTTEAGKTHEYIFLKRENPGLVALEKWNPVRKSWMRHRDKESRAQAKRFAEKIHAETEAEREKIRKKYRRD